MKIKPPNWFIEALEADGDQFEGGVDPQIEFKDEFAPSFSFSTFDNIDEIDRKTMSFAFYNDHVLKSIGAAIDIAEKLGLPRVFYSIPLSFHCVDEKSYKGSMIYASFFAEELEEGSPEWLAVVCYANWVQACYALATGAAVTIVAERMTVAGATARELELALINRVHATRGRKTLQSAQAGAISRRGSIEPKTRKVLEVMRKLTSESHSASRAADLAAQKGVGTSKAANLKLWYRHRVKDKKL